MPGWDDLSREFEAWGSENRTVTLWWRDDDAVALTPALDKLLTISRNSGVPLALAVVPAAAEGALADFLDARSNVYVLQHGYGHVNYAQPGDKASEYGPERDLESRLKELAQGFKLLSQFRQFLPVLVPPWNRIDKALLSILPEIGLTGISTFAPREPADSVSGLTCVNTHVDIINWRMGQHFLGVPAVLEQFVKHLQARRRRTADPNEPTGLLTHHLVHDAQSWSFLDRFFQVTSAHPPTRWVEAQEIFGC
ncbi:MAG: polysaccharide deacetylase family protein [Pseudomonadota bacterium]|nr:polysaccharide deacetylase family protein [Pseudomonadota bacterium]